MIRLQKEESTAPPRKRMQTTFDSEVHVFVVNPKKHEAGHTEVMFTMDSQHCRNGKSCPIACEEGTMARF